LSAIERELEPDGGAQAAAVAEAFRSHAGLVERVLRRAGVAERDLNDARQEVFIVVHRRLPEFEGRASLSTWLYRIAVHVASDYRRRAYQRREQLAGADGTAAALALAEPRSAAQAADGDACDPLQRIEQRELLEHALRALDALDPEKREAFVLAELYELPMREVAARLGCPQKTAFSRTYAARRRILAELHRHGSLPVLPLFLPLRALRGLQLNGSAGAALLPAGALLPLGALSAVVLAGALFAVLANEAAFVRVEPPTVRASAARSVRPAETAVRVYAGTPTLHAVPAQPPADEITMKPTPVRAEARRAARDSMRASTGPSAPAPVQPSVEPAPPTIEDDMQIVRSGALDLRPQLNSPLAEALGLAEPALPRRIRVRGPSDPADGVERALD
jgi:RNA polymerase sigma-70 factor (ECF subfamily)